MFSRFGRVAAALLTLAAAVLIAVALDSHDSLAGVAILVVALLYVRAMAVLLISDFVARRSAGHATPSAIPAT
jgi:hypothetical protein